MKIFVLGLDGATFDGLDPLIEEGVLPNIKGLCLEEAYGPLKTIFPPVTAPAWLGIATGMNPGKTGVFDYINKSRGRDHGMVPVSSAYYEKRAVWNYLNEKGYKTGIFNYPTLSPPPAVDGFAITGIGGYSKEKLAYPEELGAELNEITNGYENTLNLRNPKYRRNVKLFLDDIERIVTKQTKALKFLVSRKEWDFFFAVFSFTDWMQHVLWKYIDENHPLHNKEDSGNVQKRYKEIWKKIDEVIGELREIIPKDAIFMIVSDHGSGPLDSVFYPNTWLESQGWLQRKNLGWKNCVLDKVKFFSAGSDNKYSSKFLNFLSSKILKIRGSIDLIDFERSLAYSPEHNTMFGCINLTEKGKNSAGFRERLLEEIGQLPKHLEGVNRVEMFLPEKIYSGPSVDLSPDIFFIINDYRSTVEIDFSKEAFIPHPSIEMRTGGHRMEGVFIVAGDLIENGTLHDISVLDVTPTILGLYGIGIPPYLDGRCITECFKPSVQKSLNIKKSQGTGDRETVESSEKGDMEEMKKMLKSLGYM